MSSAATAASAATVTQTSPFSITALGDIARAPEPLRIKGNSETENAIIKIKRIQDHFEFEGHRFSDTLGIHKRMNALASPNSEEALANSDYRFPDTYYTAVCTKLFGAEFEGLPVLAIDTFSEQTTISIHACATTLFSSLPIGTFPKEICAIIASYAPAEVPRIDLTKTPTAAAPNHTWAQELVGEIKGTRSPFHPQTPAHTSSSIIEDLTAQALSVPPARRMAAIILMPYTPYETTPVDDSIPPPSIESFSFEVREKAQTTFDLSALLSSRPFQYYHGTARTSKTDEAYASELLDFHSPTRLSHFSPLHLSPYYSYSHSEILERGARSIILDMPCVEEKSSADTAAAAPTTHRYTLVFDTALTVDFFAVGVFANDLSTPKQVERWGRGLCRVIQEIRSALAKSIG